MDTVSIRRCDHCTEPLPEHMRRDARFCNSACRSAHSHDRQAQPDGAKWIKGYWRAPKLSAPRRRRPRPWETVSPVIAASAVIGAHSRSGATLL